MHHRFSKQKLFYLAEGTRMDTKHLVDPELLPLVEKYARFALNERTLAGLRQAISDASTSSDGSGDGLPMTVDRRSVPRLDGAGHVPIVVVAPAAARPGRGAVLHLHGGGFVMGSPEQNLPRLREQVAQLDCVLVSVDYPLAPAAVYPAAVEASYAVLRWLASEAAALGVDRQRIGVAGESAGGGLAAALALLARDRHGPHLAFQNLLYPMLDDRTGVTAENNPATGQFIWTRESNNFGWASLLGTSPGSDGVSAYAAPARAADLAGLPPTYIAVGSLDLLLDEDVAFAMRLARAGVPVELVVYPGAVHGFNLVPNAAISKRAIRHRLDALAGALRKPTTS
jgi:acetyl esterase/lipase